MKSPRVTLDQWQALVAVVEAGSYAAAAERLHKSQSAVSYAIGRLEQQLGVAAFVLEGRKARLTPAGTLLARRGRALLEEAGALEQAAGRLAAGWEDEIRVAVDILFPTWLLLRALACFDAAQAATRIELHESVIGGTTELLQSGQVDLAVSSRVPPGFLGDELIICRLICAAAPDHPLHALGRPATPGDLRRHRHLIIRDSGSLRTRDGGMLDTERRWVVGNKATSIRAAVLGLGFAWYAEDNIREELDSGRLVPVPLVEGSERSVPMYLIHADRETSGPGVRLLAEVLAAEVAGR